jgi:hypothetical protein
MRVLTRWTALALFAVLVGTVPAWAQGGSASQTGSINGRVTDSSGAVLPGVTVTITSPALMGTQTAVTNDQGVYRFPAVPPGVYAITYELPGFTTLRREGIEITLGFTATVNVELAVATLEETVTVSGESPVIDTTATRVQQNFKLEELKSIPNARDMWSLLAVTPGVQMGRIDVAGNRAGTQTGYVAYGFGNQDQQVQVRVEGINTTEGTGGAGFYFDYGSFEEVFLGTVAQGAEAPTPGVQSNFLGKSGGNKFQGGFYIDWYNNSLQSSNLPGEWLAPTAFNNNPIRRGSNEIQKYYDFNLNAGGPIRRDKMWWYGSYRRQFNAVDQVNFLFDKTFDTTLWNLSGKATYQLNQNNKFIGYYQWGQKIQPNRLFSGAYTYAKPEYTRKQNSGSWVWKGEWNGTLTNNLYMEVRFGDFGYYFPQLGYGNEENFEDIGARTFVGSDFRWQQDRERYQFTGAATYFVDNLLGGSHSFRFGGEINQEKQWNGIERYYGTGVRHQLNNGVPFRVIIGFPTATSTLGKYSSRDGILSIAGLKHSNFFVNDQWSLGRVTLNLGFRFDHYESFIPDQRQVASTVAGFSIPDREFPKTTFFTWNSVVPRLGFVYDLSGSGRTVLKVNYGYFKHNPGPGSAANANPNQNEKTLTYTWNDLNGDGRFQFGEQGALVSDLTGPGGVRIDPDITQPYTHEASAFVERQLTQAVGMRAGFVYKTADNLTQNYFPFRPIEAYTVPFSVVDRGADGLLGTSDDTTRTYYGIPNAQLPNLPATRVFQNVDAIGRWKTLEVSANKRMANRWSAGGGFNYTWTKEHGNSYFGNTVSPSLFPNSPNDTSLQEFTTWGFRVYGTIEAPWGVRLSPVFRHQSGQPYGRTLSVSAPASCACFFSGTVLVEPMDTRRMDNFNILDVRAEKVLRSGFASLRLFADFFNITNGHSAEIIVWSTGPTFERPTNVIAPRTIRLGARFEW